MNNIYIHILYYTLLYICIHMHECAKEYIVKTKSIYACWMCALCFTASLKQRRVTKQNLGVFDSFQSGCRQGTLHLCCLFGLGFLLFGLFLLSVLLSLFLSLLLLLLLLLLCIFLETRKKVAGTQN